jgi:hypothetical protein
MGQRVIFLRQLTARLVIALSLGCALGAMIAAAPAGAAGTLRVQQSDGKVNIYPDVVIRLISHKAMTITSADGKGVVKIDQAACSYAGQLRSCLLYHMEWIQSGQLHPIDLVRGTIYVNLTAQKQQLPLSSTQLPPNGVLLAFLTKKGTDVSMTGTIDEVKK